MGDLLPSSLLARVDSIGTHDVAKLVEFIRKEFLACLKDRQMPWHAVWGADGNYNGNPLRGSGRTYWVISFWFEEFGRMRLSRQAF